MKHAKNWINRNKKVILRKGTNSQIAQRKIISQQLNRGRGTLTHSGNRNNVQLENVCQSSFSKQNISISQNGKLKKKEENILLKNSNQQGNRCSKNSQNISRWTESLTNKHVRSRKWWIKSSLIQSINTLEAKGNKISPTITINIKPIKINNFNSKIPPLLRVLKKSYG